jgi:2-keto-4-pentenoate hydratase
MGSLSDEAVAEAAKQLFEARRQVIAIDALPVGCQPDSTEAGYRIQDALIACSSDRRVGYKIGATSERAQRYLGIAEPFYGQVLADNLFESPAELDPRRFPFVLVEPEFAFRMARGLASRPEPFERDEVAEAVSLFYPAVEIVTSVWTNWTKRGGTALIADNGVNGALVLGPGIADWRGFDLAEHLVSLRVDGRHEGDGRGANSLGHPLNALAWLANELAARGGGLAAGDIVTTGVVTPFLTLEGGAEVLADFGALGRVQLRLRG